MTWHNVQPKPEHGSLIWLPAPRSQKNTKFMIGDSFSLGACRKGEGLPPSSCTGSSMMPLCVALAALLTGEGEGVGPERDMQQRERLGLAPTAAPICLAAACGDCKVCAADDLACKSFNRVKAGYLPLEPGPQ